MVWGLAGVFLWLSGFWMGLSWWVAEWVGGRFPCTMAQYNTTQRGAYTNTTTRLRYETDDASTTRADDDDGIPAHFPPAAWKAQTPHILGSRLPLTSTHGFCFLDRRRKLFRHHGTTARGDLRPFFSRRWLAGLLACLLSSRTRHGVVTGARPCRSTAPDRPGREGVDFLFGLWHACMDLRSSAGARN